MKPDIHPAYYPKAKVHCVCGNTFTVGSTQEKISIEICSNCHPFYTGEDKIIDTAGRVEKFKARRVEAGVRQVKMEEIKVKKKEKEAQAKKKEKKKKTAKK